MVAPRALLRSTGEVGTPHLHRFHAALGAALVSLSACSQHVTVDLTIEGAGEVTAGVATCRDHCLVDARRATAFVASALDGGTFARWKGLCQGTEACAPVVSGPLTAVFTDPSAAGSGAIDLTIDGSGWVETSDGRQCVNGTCHWPTVGPVVLTAHALPGFDFTGFTGVCTGTGPCTLANGSTTAHFTTSALATLQIDFQGDAQGIVVDGQGAIVCSASCVVQRPAGIPISLTAAPTGPDVEATFLAPPCQGSQCTILPPAHVVIDFSRVRPLTLTFAGTGKGTVLANSAGLCSGSCQRFVPASTSLLLEGAPASNSRFVGFSGDCTGSSCAIPPGTGPVNVTVRFDALLDWNTQFASLLPPGQTSGPRAFSVLATDAGVTVAVSVFGGLRTDGTLPLVPLDPSRADVFLLGLDWDGGLTQATRLTAPLDGGADWYPLAMLDGPGGAVQLFGDCTGGTLGGLTCPQGSWAGVALEVAGGAFQRAALPALPPSSSVGEAFRAGSTTVVRSREPSLGFVFDPFGADGGTYLASPFSGGWVGTCASGPTATCALEHTPPTLAWQGCSATDGGQGLADLVAFSLSETGQCGLLGVAHAFDNASALRPRGVATNADGGVLVVGVAGGLVDLAPSPGGRLASSFLSHPRNGSLEGTVLVKSDILSVAVLPSRFGALWVGTAGPISTSFLGQPVYGPAVIAATIAEDGSLRRLWSFSAMNMVEARATAFGGRYVFVLSGQGLLFNGVPLAGDGFQRLHVVVLDD